MLNSDPPSRDDPRKMRDSYMQLGLEPGATMREIETAYWRFARELRGHPAMTPYTEAYEALVNSVKPRAKDVATSSGEPTAGPKEERATLVVRPPSRFGWPAH